MAFHQYDINELYSSADGTIQFIELVVGNLSGEGFWATHTITVTQGATEHGIIFDATTTTDGGNGNLPSTSATNNTSVLIATQGFADLALVTPNYIIPSGFLFLDGGTVNFGEGADTLTYSALPAGGAGSLNRNGTIGRNSPTNFAGVTGTIPGVIEGRAIADTIIGGTGADTLSGLSGADTLNGGAGNDTLLGGGGNDTLNGGTGVDSLAGGAGDDFYIVDDLNDVVVEIDGQGSDTIQASITGYVLPANVEFLIEPSPPPPDNSGNDLLTGDSGNNLIDGGAGNDTIYGGDGNDTLLGGTGNDDLRGQAGNDLIYGGDGSDTLRGAGGNDDIRGQAGNDVLYGGAGNDTLRGAGGNDFNRGAGGDDVLYGGAFNDTLFGGGGNDVLRGAGGDDSLQGSFGDDVLYGGGANDALNGGEGNDTLFGALGNDTLTGGLGADQFKFGAALDAASNVDTLVDFEAGVDQFLLDPAVFTALSAGALAVGSFHAGTTAADANDYILYDSATGSVFYDADGSGGGASAVLFAQVTPGLGLTANDFFVGV
ncbi:MAG: hypothetical protein HYU77_18160 [Betaproteobacteria bacterium]|nr:hypothetical protein [Betaproteobacteria bacterium]